MLKHLFVCLFYFLTASETIKCNISYVFKTLERIQRLAKYSENDNSLLPSSGRIWVKQLKWIRR